MQGLCSFLDTGVPCPQQGTAFSFQSSSLARGESLFLL